MHVKRYVDKSNNLYVKMKHIRSKKSKQSIYSKKNFACHFISVCSKFFYSLNQNHGIQVWINRRSKSKSVCKPFCIDQKNIFLAILLWFCGGVDFNFNYSYLCFVAILFQKLQWKNKCKQNWFISCKQPDGETN